MIRVWDLQQLPENVDDRLPTYTFTGPKERIGFVRFVDNTTLETLTINAPPGFPYFRWNVVTGEFVNTYDAVHDITSTVRP